MLKIAKIFSKSGQNMAKKGMKKLCWKYCSSATATGVESGKNVGFAGVTGDLVEGNNNNLAWRGRLCHSGGES